LNAEKPEKEHNLSGYALMFYSIFYFFTMVLASITTAPVRASAFPSSEAPVWKVMDCIAMMVPLKTEVVPNVAELPIYNLPPTTEATCIIKIALAFSLASKVRSPEEISSDELDLYNPGVNVSPPIFPDKETI